MKTIDRVFALFFWLSAAGVIGSLVLITGAAKVRLPRPDAPKIMSVEE
jgi:hypothetical protein